MRWNQEKILKRHLHSLEDNQAPVVQRLNDAIQRISVDKTNQAIRWIVIYPMDSVIHFSNNRGLLGWTRVYLISLTWGRGCSLTLAIYLKNDPVSTNETIVFKNATTLFSFLNMFRCFKHHHQPLWIYSKDLQKWSVSWYNYSYTMKLYKFK